MARHTKNGKWENDMDWSKGYTSAFYAYILDPATWRETTQLKIAGGNINRSMDRLRESADLECQRYDPGIEKWIRVYMDTDQQGSSAHIPLFTGLATSPEEEWEGQIRGTNLECYSVLKPADDVLLERGYYTPAGANGARLITDLLSISPAPIVITGEAPNMQEALIAEDGETRLTMADKILTAINWRIRLHGDGTIELTPEDREPRARYSPNENDVIEPSINTERDLYNCPNVLRAISGDLTAIARDDDPESPLSTVTRGREVWAEETDVALNSGESIAEYAARRLPELQQVAKTATYTRRFDPNVTAGDAIRLDYPVQGLQGIYKTTSQKIEIAYSGNTEEEVKAV